MIRAASISAKNNAKLPSMALSATSHYRPNRLRFVLPVSSHVTISLGSLSIMLLFASMAHLCMARSTLQKSKEVLLRD